MGRKVSTISEEAYQMLRTLKKPGETFTEVIERIARARVCVGLFCRIANDVMPTALGFETCYLFENRSRIYLPAI